LNKPAWDKEDKNAKRVPYIEGIIDLGHKT
jgi:hypothetical protein